MVFSVYVCLFVCFRQTYGVLQAKSAWQHPESVCHHPSTLVISPVDHMEELWMWRWACKSNFPTTFTSLNIFPKKHTDSMPIWQNCLTCAFLSDADAPAVSVSTTCLLKSFATHPAFLDCLSSLPSFPQMDTCCSASKKETARSGPG